MKDLERIEQLEEEIAAAIQAKDVDALARILAPDFLYRSPGAISRDRDGFIEGIRAIPGEITEIGLHEVFTRVLDDTVVVIGVQVAQVKLADGSIVESRVAFTDVFHSEQGEWRLSLAYGVELPTR